MGRNNRWEHFRSPLFHFCNFFYLSLKEDMLAVGPGNCCIYLTRIDFVHLQFESACLPVRTELSTQKKKHGLMKRKLHCKTSDNFRSPASTIGSSSRTSKTILFGPRQELYEGVQNAKSYSSTRPKVHIFRKNRRD